MQLYWLINKWGSSTINGGTISYELYSPTNVIPLTNNGEFSVPATGSNYSVRVSVSTSNKAVTPVSNNFSISEVPPYQKSAVLQLMPKVLTSATRTVELTVSGSNLTENYVDFWVSNDGGVSPFVQAIPQAGKYRADFATAGNNLIIRATLSSDASQYVTPVIDDINVNVVDGGLYSANGSITSRDFTVTEKNEKLIVEVHGRKNSGSFNAELKIGNLVIQGVPKTLAELGEYDPDKYAYSPFLDMGSEISPTLAEQAASLRQEITSKGLTTYYYQFALPTTQVFPFTGKMTFTLGASADGTVSPIIYSYIVFNRWDGYVTSGTFNLTTPGKPYTFDQVKVKVVGNTPTGTSTSYDLVNYALQIPTNEQVISLTSDVNSLTLAGKLNTTNNRISPSVSQIKITAVGEMAMNLNLEATSEVVSPTANITLSSDRVVGNYSLRFNHSSTGYRSYKLNLDVNYKFDTTKLPYIRVWIKPLTDQTSISFSTYDVAQAGYEIICNDANEDGTFVVGADLVKGQWNLLMLDLRETTGGGILKDAKELNFIVNTQYSDVLVDGISSLPLSTTGYYYDKAGNRTLLTEDGVTTSYQYSSAPNLLSGRTSSTESVTYNYDFNGNMISQLVTNHVNNTQIYWEYRYNELNQMVEVKKNGISVAEYFYDEAGLRYKKVDKEKREITIYVYGAGTEPMYEEIYGNLDLTQVPKSNSYLGMGRRIAVADNAGNLTYIFTDHLGSTRMTYGSSTASYDYTPFGEDLGQSGNARYKFTGKEDEGATGLCYFNARYYNPELGRFITEDSYSGDIADLLSLNRYIYVKNSPLKYVDPTGNMSALAPDCGLVVGGIIPKMSVAGVIQKGIGAAATVALPLLLSGDSKEEKPAEEKSERKIPLTGEPGSTVKVNNKDGEIHQERKYADDGLPEYDIDYGHGHHGHGSPHKHRWTRNDEGNAVRMPGEPIAPISPE